VTDSRPGRRAVARGHRRGAQLRPELRSEFKQEIAVLRGDLRTELHTGLAALETKLIRWMFVFWAGSTLTILGTLLALLKG
jgi:hypothetical protein